MLVVLLLFLVSLSYAQVIARVNNEVITRDEFQRVFFAYWKEIVHLPIAQATKEDMNTFLVEYVRSKIILNESRRMGIDVSESELDNYINRNIGSRNLSPMVRSMVKVELLTQKIVDNIAKNISITDKQVEAYYYLNLRDFKVPAQVLLKRVFADDLDTANEAYYRLINGKPIAGLNVREGESMWYSIQTLPSVVREQLHPYEVGKVSKPIDSGAGYLILKVVDKRGSGIIPLEEAKPVVREKLLKERRQEVFRQWFQRVSKGYRLELYSLQ